MRIKYTMGSLLGIATIMIVVVSSNTAFAQEADNSDKAVVTIGGSDSEEESAEHQLVRINVVDRDLGGILSYLSEKAGLNIVSSDPAINDIRVTLRLMNVDWRTVLDQIGRQEDLVINYSKEKDRIVVVERPVRVIMDFDNADISSVIQALSSQADVNIILGPEVQGKVTMHMKGVPWRDALEIILKTLGYVTVNEAFNTIRVTTPENLKRQMETRVFRLKYISSAAVQYAPVLASTKYVQKVSSSSTGQQTMSVLEVLDRVRSPDGSFTYEGSTNSIVFTDVATKLDVVERILQALDRPPKQIHIQMRLVETSISDGDSIGMQWSNGLSASMSLMGGIPVMWPFTKVQDIYDISFQKETEESLIYHIDEPSNPAGGAGLEWGGGSSLTPGVLNFNQTQATFQLMAEAGNTRILQAPEIIALDNEEAMIRVGSVIRYAEIISTNSDGVQTTGFAEAANSPVIDGVQVLMVPHITGPENNILMTLVPVIENFTGFRTFRSTDVSGGQVLELPQTTERTLVTRMMLRNGDTAMIGGMRDERESFSESKVPYLSSLPIIGRIFKHHGSEIESNRELSLYIFVTPRIIDFGRKSTLDAEQNAAKDYFRDMPLGVIPQFGEIMNR